jgi:arabinan endo-1,5-alpha-L-arabinosidase
MKYILLLLISLICLPSRGQELQKDISVHDPVMIRAAGKFYLFSTGRGISLWSSADMKSWQKEDEVFKEAPSWAVMAVPGFKNHIWAPDISFWKGKYYLYYSISAFGKNTSCIGLATNTTLDPHDSHYRWEDQGKVIQSYPGLTNWNAIDPNLIADKKGNAYLAFGSFWSGLKLAKLSPDRLKVVGDTINLPVLASRTKQNVGKPNLPSIDNNPPDAGGNAIEGPFIFHKKEYYYLFASIDYCCKGPQSTYKMIIGRSRDIAGPYLDKEGKDMREGGGSLLLKSDPRWYGAGHNGVCSFRGIDYLVYHGYDAEDQGKSKLQIKKLNWTNAGWPVVL